MGADGYIAIYDWEKVKAFLAGDAEHAKLAWSSKVIATGRPLTPEEIKQVKGEVAAMNSRNIRCYAHVTYVRNGIGGGDSTWYESPSLSDGDIVSLDFEDETKPREPFTWPGYICDWTCNGKRACLVYWGDNLDRDPFEDCEWLREWADANALLVADQEVWT